MAPSRPAPAPDAVTPPHGAVPRDDGLEAATPPARFDPATLRSPLTRRRAALVAGGLVVAGVLIAFGRQVGDASAASARAADLRDTNAALRAEQSALQEDLTRVQGEQYIGLAGRAYGLGRRHEIPFTLAADAPSLPPDAPGSASLRVGGEDGAHSPLEAWLDLLFGPGR